MTQTFEIKGILSGNVLKTVTNPAAIIDTEYGQLVYIGDAEEVAEQLQEQQSVTNAYRSNKKLVIVNIPHVQDEVTKAFSVAGYALELFKNQQPGAKSVLAQQGSIE